MQHRHRAGIFQILAVATLFSLASAALAFPFWLESPRRDNPGDAKSGLAPWPTPFRGATPLPQPTATETPLPPPTAAIVFEDFESSLTALNAATYDDTVGSVVAYNVVSGTAHSGTNSLQLNVDTSSGSWGAGVDFWSNYGAPTIDANGAVSLELWILTDSDISFSLRFRETGDQDVSTDYENWMTDPIVLSASVSWQAVSVPITDFYEDIWGNPDLCGPNCAQPGSGDNVIQTDQVSRVQLQFDGGFGPAVVYLDDIQFVTGPPPAPTLTPTITPTLPPCSPSGDLLGIDTQGAYVFDILDPYPDLSKHTLAVPATGASMAVLVGAVTGQIQLMIYDASGPGGAPGNLLGWTAPFLPVADSWNTQDLTSQIGLAPGDYWLGFQKEAAGTRVFQSTGVDGDAYYTWIANPFGSPPTTYPAGITENFRWSVYLNYCP